MIPERVGGRVRDTSKDSQKVRFESADGSFSNVAAMYVVGYKLEGAVPLVLDGKLVGLASLVVGDLQVSLNRGLVNILVGWAS